MIWWIIPLWLIASFRRFVIEYTTSFHFKSSPKLFSFIFRFEKFSPEYKSDHDIQPSNCFQLLSLSINFQSAFECLIHPIMLRNKLKLIQLNETMNFYVVSWSQFSLRIFSFLFRLMELIKMDQVESLSLTFNEAIEAIKQNRKKTQSWEWFGRDIRNGVKRVAVNASPGTF